MVHKIDPDKYYGNGRKQIMLICDCMQFELVHYHKKQKILLTTFNLIAEKLSVI